jgi:hypothetical protein
VPGPQGSPEDGGFNIMMIMVAWLVIASVLFIMRPNSMRNNNEKPRPSQNVSTLYNIQTIILDITGILLLNVS